MTVYEVRSEGQFVGTYRAASPKAAIQRAKDDQAATAATFRRSQPAIVLRDLTAQPVARS